MTCKKRTVWSNCHKNITELYRSLVWASIGEGPKPRERHTGPGYCHLHVASVMRDRPCPGSEISRAASRPIPEHNRKLQPSSPAAPWPKHRHFRGCVCESTRVHSCFHIHLFSKQKNHLVERAQFFLAICGRKGQNGTCQWFIALHKKLWLVSQGAAFPLDCTDTQPMSTTPSVGQSPEKYLAFHKK